MSATAELVKAFLSKSRFAVVGASQDRSKFGNKLLRCYLQHNFDVTPINPKSHSIEGLLCVSSLSSLPEPRSEIAISVVTPPSITLSIVEEAKNSGIEYIWFQPGSESPEVIQKSIDLGLKMISNQCLLVVLGYDNSFVPLNSAL